MVVSLVVLQDEEGPPVVVLEVREVEVLVARQGRIGCHGCFLPQSTSRRGPACSAVGRGGKARL